MSLLLPAFSEGFFLEWQTGHRMGFASGQSGRANLAAQHCSAQNGLMYEQDFNDRSGSCLKAETVFFFCFEKVFVSDLYFLQITSVDK